MATQHNVRQFLAADDTDDVLNVRVEIDRAVHQVSALAEAGQSRRVDLVPGLTQQPRHPLVAPAAMPSAMNENERGHVVVLPLSAGSAQPNIRAPSCLPAPEAAASMPY
jgi:hypothetical protein